MIRVGIVGSQFAANLHAEALAATGRAEIVGVVSPTPAHREDLAARWGTTPYASLEELLTAASPDAVSLACPNAFHHPATLAAAAHGVHVICEKPLAMNLRQADEMLAACAAAGVHLLYGEELCFAPTYRRVKDLIDAGAFGDVFFLQHRERHDGPHARWFHDPDVSGGGALLDMACHGIGLVRWLMDREPVAGVYAQAGRFRHDGPVDDHAVVVVRFAGGALATIDGSWAAPGGVDERLEVVGTGGSTVADLARGSALLVHSENGYGYAAEKAGSTIGWSHAAYREAWHWGWVDEFRHFVDCLEGRAEPEQTGGDGRAALEIVMAAYASAATGQEIRLPFTTDAARPIDLWGR